MVGNKSSLQGCNLFSCCLVYSGNLGKVSKTYLRNPSEKSPLCIIFFLSRKKLTDFGGTPPPFPPTLRTDSTKKLLAMDRPKLKMMIENGSKDSILSNQSPNSFSIYPLNGKICDCYLLHERSPNSVSIWTFVRPWIWDWEKWICCNLAICRILKYCGLIWSALLWIQSEWASALWPECVLS